MAVNPSSLGGPKPQYEDGNGVPAVGYKLFWYVGGSVSTKQNTYTDATGATPNANPIVLNSLGEPPAGVFFTAGLTYKAVLALPTDTDPPTSPVWTVDNIKGINDTTVTISQWVAGPTPTFVSGTSFTLAGDQTSTFITGLRLQIVDAVNTKYATVASATYDGSSLTTVNTTNDSGATLQTPLSAVSYGLLSPTNVSIPQNISGGTGVTVTYTNGQPTISTVVLPQYRSGIIGSSSGPSTTATFTNGTWADSLNVVYITLLTSLAKTTAAWAVGAGGAKAEAGATANSTTYHWYVIRRPDTGVVDLCFSTSATGLVAGSYVSGGGNVANAYTQFRRVLSIRTNGSAQWNDFFQVGSEVTLITPVQDVSTANPGTASVSATLTSVPTGVNVYAHINASLSDLTPTGALVYFRDLGAADLSPSTTAAPGGQLRSIASGAPGIANVTVRTNTSAQIGYRLNASDANVTIRLVTLGWNDPA